MEVNGDIITPGPFAPIELTGPQKPVWRAAFTSEFRAELDLRMSRDWAQRLATSCRRVPPPLRVAKRIVLSQLGAVHGEWDEQTREIKLNPADWDSKDTFGSLREHTVIDRLTHTVIHEFGHAWGSTYGYDNRPEWKLLSDWRYSPDVRPEGYSRYVEIRPGWSKEKQPWVFKHGSWFPRVYSSKSPFEDLADCILYLLAGWGRVFDGGGELKRDYVRQRLIDAGAWGV